MACIPLGEPAVDNLMCSREVEYSQWVSHGKNIDAEKYINELSEYAWADDQVKNLFRRLLSSLDHHLISSYDVDFGELYRALSFNVLLNDEFEFLFRSEVDDPDGLVVFSIRREGELIYMGKDNLDALQANIDRFFLNIRRERERVDYYFNYELSQTTIADVKPYSQYQYPRTSESKFSTTGRCA